MLPTRVALALVLLGSACGPPPAAEGADAAASANEVVKALKSRLPRGAAAVELRKFYRPASENPDRWFVFTHAPGDPEKTGIRGAIVITHVEWGTDNEGPDVWTVGSKRKCNEGRKGWVARFSGATVGPSGPAYVPEDKKLCIGGPGEVTVHGYIPYGRTAPEKYVNIGKSGPASAPTPKAEDAAAPKAEDAAEDAPAPADPPTETRRQPQPRDNTP